MDAVEFFEEKGFSREDHDWFVDYAVDYVNFLMGFGSSRNKQELVEGHTRFKEIKQKMGMEIFDPVNLAEVPDMTVEIADAEHLRQALKGDSGIAAGKALVSFFDYYSDNYFAPNILLPEILDKPFDLSNVHPESYQKITRKMVEEEVENDLQNSHQTHVIHTDQSTEPYKELQRRLDAYITDMRSDINAGSETTLDLCAATRKIAYNVARELLPETERVILDMHIQHYYRHQTGNRVPEYSKPTAVYLNELLNVLQDVSGPSFQRASVKMDFEKIIGEFRKERGTRSL